MRDAQRRAAVPAAERPRGGRHRSRSSSREKEGLALINGTDGMLGMLVLAAADLRAAAADRRHHRRDERRGAARHRRGVRRRPAARCGRTPGRPRAPPTCARCSPARRSWPATAARTDTRVQDAYSLRCSPQVHGAARDTLAHAETVAARELASAIDNPVVTLDGRVESNGNFHGAPVGYVLDFLAIAVADLASIAERRTDRFLDVARSHGLPPFLADDPGVDSGHMIAQYTQAAHRLRAQAAGRPGLRRLDPVQRHAGGPRVDGLVGGAQAAPRRRRADPGAGDRAADRGPGAGPACPARRPRPPRPRSSRRLRATGPRRPRRGPVPRPGDRSRPWTTSGPATRCAPPRRSPGRWSKRRTFRMIERDLTMEGARPVRAPRGTTLTARSWQTEAPLRMLMNNLDPDVAERPDDLVVYGGTGRAARSWNAFDAIVRTLTELREDETMLVQSGKPVGVMRTHEWAPRVLIANSNLVGDWATWPEFRRLEAARADDVRPDDRRIVDLHRHPGHPAGHVRDVRGRGGEAVRRLAGRHAHRHRRLRRDGRRPAAGGHAERRRLPGHRRRPGTAGAAGRHAVPGRGRRRPRRRAGSLPRGARRAGAAVGRPGRQLRGRAARTAAARRPGRHRHRPDVRARPALVPARGGRTG